MISDITTNLKQRTWWANALLVFCLYMTIVYLPFDLFFKPLAQDQEVWFGLMLTGWSAKLGGVAHWLIYALGAYGLLHQKAWLRPWISLYVLQVALSMLLWAMLDHRGSGLMAGLIAAGPFIGLAALLHFKPNHYLNERAGQA